MSTLQVAGRKSLVLLSGGAYPELADEIASHIGVTITPTTRREFANGELFIRPNDSVRGTDAFVVQAHTSPINDWLMESLILVDSLKRASAKRITVVAPFYPYARQDKKHRGREPISARLIADLFKTAGADRLMVVDLHTAQIQGFFDGPVDHLFAMPLLAEHVRAKYDIRRSRRTWLLSRRTPAGCAPPSSGPTNSAASSIAFVHKTPQHRRRRTTSLRTVSWVTIAGRRCLLIDDMIDTAGSICKAADLLFDEGATDVDHRRDARHLLRRRRPTGSRTVGSARSSSRTRCPSTPAKRFDKLTDRCRSRRCSVRRSSEVFEDGSVTSLFHGRS